jgi:GT2 family glycosyltransferase
MPAADSRPANSVPTVCCVLLNWNGWADTIVCLDSLAKQDYPSLRVLVVDNGSTDDSVAHIRAAHPNVTVLEAGANLGFARGCNLGMRRAANEGDDYVWLLNNDTVAPPDTCSKLIACAVSEPQAGLIGSVLYFMHDPARMQAWGGGSVSPWRGRATHFTSPSMLGPNSYLTFASVLIPREVLFRVGVMYEGFFMYWEDTDYALRVTRAGYSLAVAADTAVLHKEGGSAGPRSPVIDRYSAASGLHFLRRHSSAPQLSMAIFLAVRLASRIVRGEWKNVQAVISASKDYVEQRNVIYSETL